MTRRRLAVIGGGVSGLTAAWVLQRSADVYLYEANGRLGGHADTHDVPTASGATVAVDTGFIVHNQRTYPTLLRLFAALGVTTQESDMSMSVRCDGCGLEYAGARGVRGLFAQPRSLGRPAYLRMLGEVLRFHRAARALLASEGPDVDQPLGEFVRDGRFSPYFVNHFLTPLVSAVWSCAPGTAARYPARYLFAFLDHHGMLSVTGSPPWRTVTGGSRGYVERATKQLTAVHTATPVRAVRRLQSQVEVRDDQDQLATFDGVVIATHPDQALRLLADPTPAERAVLGAFRYSRNETLLHTDTAMLPRSAGAQASWNYRQDACESTADRVLVSYDLTRLQRLAGPERYVVTLGGGDRVEPGSVIDRMVYEHPIYTPASVAAQRRLPGLNTAVTAYAGAYHGWGFHEDGCRSGLAAAEHLGGSW
jgi:predicted NAD/FAD-binding protein